MCLLDCHSAAALTVTSNRLRTGDRGPGNKRPSSTRCSSGRAPDGSAAGCQPARGSPDCPLEQGAGDHRGSRCGQDHPGQLNPEDPDRQAGSRGALRAHGSGGQAVVGKYRAGGEDHPPPVGNGPADGRIPPDRGASARLRSPGRGRGQHGGCSVDAFAAACGARRGSSAHCRRCRPAALRRAGPGAGGHHRVQRDCGCPLDRSVPPGGRQPGHRQRTPD